MSGDAVEASAPASFLDLVSAIMDAPERPLDFAVIVELGDGGSPGAAALRRGAARARHRYPQSGSILRDDRWVLAGDACADLEESVLPTGDDTARAQRLQSFLDAPLELGREAPLRQLLLTEAESGRRVLATRCHHAASDLLGVIRWLTHQLRTAAEHDTERDTERDTPVVFEELPLQKHDAPVRKSRYAGVGPSRGLWTPSAQRSRTRAWRSVVVQRDRLRRATEAWPFTYNDLLAASALETARRWNEAHAAATSGLALWFPINIRKRTFEGFGNGSSRVRIYDRGSDRGTAARCDDFRKQLEWVRAHGEWAVPEPERLKRLPGWLRTHLLRAYLGRPWVDMGTLLFSHAERASADDAPTLPGVTRVEIVAMLHHRHPVGIAGLTLGDQTHLTFTYDPAQLGPPEIDRLTEIYEAVLREADSELQ